MCEMNPPFLEKASSINPQPVYGSRAGTKQSGIKLQSQPSAPSTTSWEGKMEEARMEDGRGAGCKLLPGDMCVYVDVMLGRSCGSMLQSDLLLIERERKSKWKERWERRGDKSGDAVER